MLHDLLVHLVGISSTGEINKETFWVFITAIFTALLFWVAYKQLGGLNKVSRAEFNYKLTGDFFTSEARTIIFLIENKWLNFHKGSKDKAAHFSIKENEDTRNQQIKKFFTTNEVDDWVLGPLEDLANLEIKGLLDMDMVYETFGGYLRMIWKDKAIKEYVEWARADKEEKDSKFIYKGIEGLFDKCESYMKAKLEKRLWRWKFVCWCRESMLWEYFYH